MSFDLDLSSFITYRDREVLEQVRDISREKVTEHENQDINVGIIDSEREFYTAFALDIVTRIKTSLENGKSLVLHGPVTPLVPGSLLQTERADVTILGGVADAVEVNMS